jgi:hypothetical protein
MQESKIDKWKYMGTKRFFPFVIDDIIFLMGVKEDSG